MDPEIEKALVNAFVVKAKRERTIGLLSDPKRRSKILDSLYHYGDLDPDKANQLPSNKQNRKEILKLLLSKGAPENCYVISTDREKDGSIMPLAEAIDALFASFNGTLISCVPVKLGYYEGEDPNERYILEK